MFFSLSLSLCVALPPGDYVLRDAGGGPRGMVRVLLKWRYPFQAPTGSPGAGVGAGAAWLQPKDRVTERETDRQGGAGGTAETRRRRRRRKGEEEEEEEQRKEIQIQRPVAKPRVKVRPGRHLMHCSKWIAFIWCWCRQACVFVVVSQTKKVLGLNPSLTCRHP